MRGLAVLLVALTLGGCATPGDLASAAVTGVYSPAGAAAQLLNRRLAAQAQCRDCYVNCGANGTESARVDCRARCAASERCRYGRGRE